MQKMKKLLIVLVLTLLVVGCGNMMDTPTKKVEALLNKYQTQDKEVLEQLDSVVEEAGILSDDQQDKYRNLMKRQYQNLNYKIKNETEDGENATVTVEIQVFDYGKAIADAENYLANNTDEFIISETNSIDSSKYMDYKIEKMSSTSSKVTYTINFSLTKVDDEWVLNNLNDIDRLKLHELYY